MKLRFHAFEVYSLWGAMKNTFYANNTKTIQEIKAEIYSAIAEISPETIDNVCQ